MNDNRRKRIAALRAKQDALLQELGTIMRRMSVRQRRMQNEIDKLLRKKKEQQP